MSDNRELFPFKDGKKWRKLIDDVLSGRSVTIRGIPDGEIVEVIDHSDGITRSSLIAIEEFENSLINPLFGCLEFNDVRNQHERDAREARM